MIRGTWVWYRNRHNKNATKVEDVSVRSNQVDAQNDEDTQGDKTPFLSYRMGEGEGKRKIGTHLRLTEDVYAVLFCGLLKVEYKESHEQNMLQGVDAKQDGNAGKLSSGKTLSKKSMKNSQQIP